MDEEFDYETIEKLNELIKITYSIKKIYDLLLFLEVNKRIPADYDSNTLPINYEDNKKEALNMLASLKLKEDEIYEYFEEDYLRAVDALDYLDEKENERNNMTHNDELCFTRIYEKLSKIELIKGIEQDFEENITEINKTQKFKCLLNDGLTEEEASYFYLDYSSILDNSISNRYISLLDHEIMHGDKPFIYLKAKLEEAFASPNKLEDTLLHYSFNRHPKNLSEELKPNYEIKLTTLLEFITLEINDNLLDIVNKINNTENETELKTCIILFKTYLLYLDDANIKRAIGLTEALINDENIKELLISLIYKAKELQKQENEDLKGKTLN